MPKVEGSDAGRSGATDARWRALVHDQRARTARLSRLALLLIDADQVELLGRDVIDFRTRRPSAAGHPLLRLLP
jgi:hypothetical protein